MALVWAAGVMWLAVRIAGPEAGDNTAAQPTDVTGATISDEDLKNFADFADAN